MKHTRDEIKDGKDYFSFYMELAGNGNSIKNCTGVFKVKLQHRDKLGYGSWGVSGGTNTGYESNLTNRLNGSKPCNGVDCEFYDTEEEAIIAHDKQVLKFVFTGDTAKQKKAKLNKKISK
jgi:hypothetical protein